MTHCIYIENSSVVIKLAFATTDRWLLTLDMIIKDEFYKHHLQVVSSAIQSARRRGVATVQPPHKHIIGNRICMLIIEVCLYQGN
jgi:hypothetical protein